MAKSFMNTSYDAHLPEGARVVDFTTRDFGDDCRTLKIQLSTLESRGCSTITLFGDADQIDSIVEALAKGPSPADQPCPNTH